MLSAEQTEDINFPESKNFICSQLDPENSEYVVFFLTCN